VVKLVSCKPIKELKILGFGVFFMLIFDGENRGA